MTTMLESLAQTNHAQRYNASRSPHTRRGGNRLHETRTRAGWLLVGLGLKLALAGRHDARQRLTLIQR